MKALFWAVMAALAAISLALLALPPPVFAQALAQPCVAQPCKVTGVAAKVTIPIPLKPGSFAGKFELVPLFNAGHKPRINNGHQDYALRNAVSFQTAAGRIVTAPAGMPTDLASIPQAAWSLGFAPDGSWSEAATLHDDCYRTRGSFLWIWPLAPHEAPTTPHKTFAGLSGPPFTRADCDELLRQGMVALGTSSFKRVVIYEAVRTFGGVSGWGH